MARTKPEPNSNGFFPVGHLKNKIFATPPVTIEELKRRIIMEIQNITQKTLRKFFQNMTRSTVMCKNLNEVHFQHML